MSTPQPAEPNRRDLLKHAAMGCATLGCLGHLALVGGALAPRVRYEPPRERRIGPASRFPPGITFLREERLFIVREEDQLRALSAACTHLGCTVDKTEEGFRCPCHGSAFSADGTNLSGPAPRPLPWRPLRLAGDGAVIVDLGAEVAASMHLAVGG